MKALSKALNRLEEYIMIVLFPLMVLLVFVATMVRYLGLGSMPWADEGSRYMMICLVFAAVSYGFRQDTHLGMSFVVDRIPQSLRPAFDWLRAAILLAFIGLMIYSTVVLIQNQMAFSQRSAALRIPMYYMYIVMLVGWILMAIRTVQAAFSKPDISEDEEVPSI